jgi:Zn-dependent protease/CBS domain-containing protein
MKRTFKVFTISGIEISLHYTWFIVFALVTYSLAASYFPVQIRGHSHLTYWLMGGVSALLLFVSVLLHELSHSLVAKKEKLGVDKIVLFLFGGVSEITEEPKSAKDEFRMAIAGPLASFVLAFIFWLLLIFVLKPSGLTILSSIFWYLAVINFMLGVFNLLPGFPLDGGRVLRAYWWNKSKNLMKATLVAANAGKGLAILMMVLGGFELLLGYFVGGMWFIFIGLFLRQAAESGYQRVLIRDILSGMKVKELMSSNVVCVGSDLSIHDLVDEFFLKHRFISYPVCEKGKLLGIVTLNSVKQIPREKWKEEKTGAATQEVPEKFILHPEEDAVEALEKIIASDLGRLPVLKDGGIVGILSRRDIMNLLTIKTDLGFRRENQ